MPSSRSQIFVFTAGDADARTHLRHSIETPISLDRALATFPPELHGEIRPIHEHGGLYAWGAIPGRQNTPRWERMNLDDWVLCVYDNTYHYAAQVRGKYDNDRFAREVWHENESGQTWNLMYFLSKPQKVQIPVTTLASYLNTAYRGFSRIGDERLERIEREFGSTDAFIQQRVLGSQPGVSIHFLIRSNETSPYADEVGVTYHYTSNVPNSRKLLGGGGVVVDRKTADGPRLVGFGELGPATRLKGGEEVEEFKARFLAWKAFEPPRSIPGDLLAEIQSQPNYNPQHAIRPITESIFRKLTSDSSPAQKDLAAIVTAFISSLKLSRFAVGEHQQELVRAFIASLATKPLVILTGLSGSGKTQLALRFGEWLGNMHVAAVRPDWTGAEALFGYEDALKPQDGALPAWTVPEPLAFLLRAANDPDRPYLLILDEMNLAHVERYFADALSGMESGKPCLPNLVRGIDGFWRQAINGPTRLLFPSNVFVIGTVNVDETTYMFSPKVLDRANTFEFRVKTSDLVGDYTKPVSCTPSSPSLVRGFLAIATDSEWQVRTPYSRIAELAEHLRRLHEMLARYGLEFGHRVFYEATRFAAMYEQAGESSLRAALDRIIMQKVLPRLHGSRRRLEVPLTALAIYCLNLPDELPKDQEAQKFSAADHDPATAALPISFEKVTRMITSLRTNQFTSFTE